MSLRPLPAVSIPEETRRVAQAAFPKGTTCLRIADELGTLYRDEQFSDLFPTRGQPAASPARLALASVLQYVEGLSDRQAADAVRGRIDWKYALALELTDPGFDHTVLSEFRSRLVQGQAELQLLDTLLERCRDLGLIRERGRQRTDSTHVLAAVRVLNRLERVGETMRAALNDLAVIAPDWLQALAPAEWYRRYGRRVENYHLPKTDAAREEMARVIAADGERLLAAVDAASDQPVLAQLPAVVTLRRLWAEQYTGAPGQLRWREVKDMPSPAGLISSPYDTDARYSTKREMNWVGYKAHLTETCDADRPHLIVNVETTPATTPDDNMIKEVHESEKGRDLLPGEHLVDKGYTDSEVLVAGARVRRDDRRPGGRGPRLAGACRRGLRQGGLRGGLGPARGDMSSGQGEHLLAPEHLPEERDGLRGAVLAQGLHAVSLAVAVHEVGEGAADHRAAAARAARSTAGDPARAGYGGVPVAVRGASGDRGDS